MILYQITHGGAWGWVLAHRLTQTKNQDAILLVGDDIPGFFGRQKNLMLLENPMLFNKVIPIKGAIGSSLSDLDEMEHLIINYFDEFLSNNSIDLLDMDAIYTSADTHHSFGVYCSLKSIPYYFFESTIDHCHSRQPPRDAWLFRSKTWIYPNILKKHGAYNADNDLIIPILYPYSKNPFPSDKRVELFDPKAALLELNDEEKAELKKHFEMPRFSPHEKYCLVVFSSLNIMRLNIRDNGLIKKYLPNLYNAYDLITQLSMDLFCPDSYIPVFKWHPLYEIDDADEMFPNAITVDRIIDIQIFDMFCKKDNVRFDRMISFGSTAVRKTDILVDNGEHIDIGKIWYACHLINRVICVYEIILRSDVDMSEEIFITNNGKTASNISQFIIDFAKLYAGLSILWVSESDLENDIGNRTVIIADPTHKISKTLVGYVRKHKKAVWFLPNPDSDSTPDWIFENKLNNAYVRKRISKKLLAGAIIPKQDELFNIVAQDSEIQKKLYEVKIERTFANAKYSMYTHTSSEAALKTWRQNEYNAWLERRITRLETAVAELTEKNDKENNTT